MGQRNRLRSSARGRYGRRAEAKAGRDTGSVDHNNLWKILKEMGMPDHFIAS